MRKYYLKNTDADDDDDDDDGVFWEKNSQNEVIELKTTNELDLQTGWESDQRQTCYTSTL